MGEDRLSLLEMDFDLLNLGTLHHHDRPHYRAICLLQWERLWVEHDFDHDQLDLEFRSFGTLDQSKDSRFEP